MAVSDVRPVVKRYMGVYLLVVLVLTNGGSPVNGFVEENDHIMEEGGHWNIRQIDSSNPIFKSISPLISKTLNINSGRTLMESLITVILKKFNISMTGQSFLQNFLLPVFTKPTGGSPNDTMYQKIIQVLINLKSGPAISSYVQGMLPTILGTHGASSGQTIFKNVVPSILKMLHIPSESTAAMVTNQCRFDIEFSVDNFNKIEKGYSTTANWGRQMNEAFGKLSGGITQGNLYWMGDFWQCTSIGVWRNENSTKTRPDFTGKYCLVSVGVPILPLPSLKVGTCFPSSCNTEDVQELVRSNLKLPFRALVNESFCQTSNDSSWDGTSRTIGGVISLLILFVAFATIFDVILGIVQAIRSSQLKTTDSSRDRSTNKIKSIILSFSALRNASKLLQPIPSEGNNLSSLHGIRTISISWVIIGHIFMLLHQDYPWKNQLHAVSYLKDFLFQVILGGEYAVDTFLTMSGFLVAYLFLVEMRKNEGRFNILMYYLHRIWRLLPAYALIILYMCGPFGGIGHGPIWPAAHSDMTNCRERWWQNLLFINNLYSEKEQCLPQAWYLCLDLMFYFLAPIILYPLFKKPILGHFMFFVFFVTSFVVPAWIIHYYNLASYPAWNAELWQRDQFMNKVYNKPWCRMSAYLIGMAYGYLLYLMSAKAGKMIMKPLVVFVMWSVAIVTSLAIIYSTYPVLKGDKEMHHVQFVFYGSLTRPAWAASVGWVMLACATGYGGYVNSVLGWTGFQPFSRLTYSAYLVHFTVVAHFFASRTDSFYIDYYVMAYFCIAMYFATILFAMLLALLAESPFMALEKLLIHVCSPAEHHQTGEAGKLISADLPQPPTTRKRPPPIIKQNRVAEHKDLQYHPLVNATSDTETVYHDLDDNFSLRSDYESSTEDTIYRKAISGPPSANPVY